MPYIKKDRRAQLRGPLEELENCYESETRDGDLNYIISTLIDGWYFTTYKDLNAAIGVLECVKQEFYRRVAAPYEDQKIAENGDVYRTLRSVGVRDVGT